MTQETALEILKTGANVFLTGEPGAGKTHTINRYIDYLRERDIEPAVTASTGIAATHIGGSTIHSYSGIGIKDELTPYELDEMTQKEQLVKRVTKNDVLIIEEVSMLDARVVDMVDQVLRTLRQNPKPFGGMQVVLVGDFFQLPPVSKGRDMTFAFAGRAWKNLQPVTCYLTEQYRQEDSRFLEILSAIRHQEVTEEIIDEMRSHQISEADVEDVTATKLYSHNADVDAINERELAKLDGYPTYFEMESSGSQALVEQLKRGCLSPETLALKEGAVVMFTKNNFELGYVNGTIGTVVDFEERWPIVETKDGERISVQPENWNVEENGKVRASVTQLPLRLAWAVTVHKSQGMSLDAALVDLSRAFEYGQGYVALSRVRSLGGLYLVGFNERALEVHPEVAEADAWFRKHAAAAEKRRADMTDEQLAERHTNFLEACGGRLQPRSADEKKKLGKEQSARAQKGGTYERTRELVKEGKNVSEIAAERGMAVSTIFGHVEKLRQNNRLSVEDVAHLREESERSNEEITEMQDAFRDLKTVQLKPVFKKLGERFSYDELRLARVLSDV